MWARRRSDTPPGGVGARRRSAPTHSVGPFIHLSVSALGPPHPTAEQAVVDRSSESTQPQTLGSPRPLARVVMERTGMGLLRDLVGAAAPEKDPASLVNNEGMQERMIELRGVEKSYPQGGG